MWIIPKQNLSRAFKKSLSQPGYALRAFYSRMRSYLTYKFFNGYSAYPETISLFLTYRCNLRCKMCGQWGENGIYHKVRPKDDLSTEKIFELLDEVRAFRPNITLFGGEPFLHPDWHAIVQRARQNGLRVNVITNGTLLKKLSDQIIASDLDEIILSLDGPRHVHDQIRNKKGAFDSIMEGISKINEHKKVAGKKRPAINFTSVLTPENILHLRSMADIAKSVDANSITFHHLIFISSNQFERFRSDLFGKFAIEPVDWSGFVRDNLPAMDVDMLQHQIRELRQLNNGIDISFYPNLPDDEIGAYYTEWNFRSQSYPNRCISPWMVAYIFPDGSVRPFHSMNFNAGNIKQETFHQIWNGEKFRAFRKFVKQKKCFSVCTRCTEFYRY